MAIRNIVKEGDPILNKVCRPVTNFDDRLATLLDDMRETMIAADGVGLAVGMLRTSGRFAAASAADLATYGYAAHGAERIGELYYRIHLNDHVELTPSLQYIARPAANPDGKGIALVGVRARVGF